MPASPAWLCPSHHIQQALLKVWQHQLSRSGGLQGYANLTRRQIEQQQQQQQWQQQQQQRWFQHGRLSSPAAAKREAQSTSEHARVLGQLRTDQPIKHITHAHTCDAHALHPVLSDYLHVRLSHLVGHVHNCWVGCVPAELRRVSSCLKVEGEHHASTT
jgi:hypothetical protein